jgi:beta-1,4-mannosyl-glycoprotein beta-1,4-N-acetylglucosaminyltransferase
MIIDSFMFFNELDLLEGRLEYLNDVVDYFIIVENDTTHNGNSKPFNFHENASRYEKYHHKIIYLPMSYKNDDSGNYCGFSHQSIKNWNMENYQRNYISNILHHFPNDAFIIINDLDEIPNKQALIQSCADIIKKNNTHLLLMQEMFYCNLNYKQLSLWQGPVVTSIEVAKEKGIQWFRDTRWGMHSIVNGGWHLSSWNTLENIKYKIENFAHQEFNTPEFTDLAKIADRIKNGKDLFGREDNLLIPFDTSTLPKDFADIFLKYTPNQEYTP